MSSTSTYVPAGSSASSDATQPDDVLETLKEYLPKDISTNYDQFVDIVNRDYRSFKPFGEKINEYSQERDDGSIEQFEIYKVGNYTYLRLPSNDFWWIELSLQPQC